MNVLTEIEVTGNNAVKRLRTQKLASGLAFMINSSTLPSNQCYMEYPDGTISIVKILQAHRDYEKVRTLSSEEANSLRIAHNLF
jgi:hypothetical protein